MARTAPPMMAIDKKGGSRRTPIALRLPFHALALMSSVSIDVKPLISRTFKFRDSVEAFDFALKMTAMVRQAPQNDRNVDPIA